MTDMYLQHHVILLFITFFSPTHIEVLSETALKDVWRQREIKKSVGGEDICTKKGGPRGRDRCFLRTHSLTGARTTSDCWFFSLQIPSLLGGREVVGGAELF